MPVILVRIDDRLIHGQVTEGWGKRYKPDFILVVSDNVAESDWERELCLAALPPEIEGEVVDSEHAAGKINELNADTRDSYILFESPEETYNAVRNNAVITKINVGGLHFSEGKREITDYIYVDEKDSLYLKALKDRGVELEFRDLPDRSTIDVMAIL